MLAVGGLVSGKLFVLVRANLEGPRKGLPLFLPVRADNVSVIAYCLQSENFRNLLLC